MMHFEWTELLREGLPHFAFIFQKSSVNASHLQRKSFCDGVRRKKLGVDSLTLVGTPKKKNTDFTDSHRLIRVNP